MERYEMTAENTHYDAAHIIIEDRSGLEIVATVAEPKLRAEKATLPLLWRAEQEAELHRFATKQALEWLTATHEQFGDDLVAVHVQYDPGRDNAQTVTFAARAPYV